MSHSNQASREAVGKGCKAQRMDRRQENWSWFIRHVPRWPITRGGPREILRLRQPPLRTTFLSVGIG